MCFIFDSAIQLPAQRKHDGNTHDSNTLITNLLTERIVVSLNFLSAKCVLNKKLTSIYLGTECKMVTGEIMRNSKNSRLLFTI